MMQRERLAARRIVSLCIAFVLVATAAMLTPSSPASAAVRSFAGTTTATFEFPDKQPCPGNAFIGSVSGKIMRPHLPTWTFNAPRICVSAIGHQAQIAGRATLIAPDRADVYAGLTAFWADVEGDVTASIYFHVHGGTAEFTHATGLISANPGTLDILTGRFEAPTTGSIKT